MDPETVPDLTVEELREMGEDDEYSLDAEDIEEIEEDFEEMVAMLKYTGAAVGLGELLVNNYITFREYIRLIEGIEDLADEEGVRLP